MKKRPPPKIPAPVDPAVQFERVMVAARNGYTTGYSNGHSDGLTLGIAAGLFLAYLILKVSYALGE